VAAGGRPPGRWPPAPRAVAPTPPPPPAARPSDGGRRRTLLTAGAGVLALAAVAVVLATTVFGGGDDPVAETTAPNRVTPPATAAEQQREVVPSEVTVAVLNGAGVTGLARQVADDVRQRGFRVPEELVKNATTPRGATLIAYEEGARREALAVARAIGKDEDALDRLDANTRTDAGSGTTTPRVVVVVGSDQNQQ
jgi:hypothetical protein